MKPQMNTDEHRTRNPELGTRNSFRHCEERPQRETRQSQLTTKGTKPHPFPSPIEEGLRGVSGTKKRIMASGDEHQASSIQYPPPRRAPFRVREQAALPAKYTKPQRRKNFTAEAAENAEGKNSIIKKKAEDRTTSSVSVIPDSDREYISPRLSGMSPLSERRRGVLSYNSELRMRNAEVKNENGKWRMKIGTVTSASDQLPIQVTGHRQQVTLFGSRITAHESRLTMHNLQSSILNILFLLLFVVSAAGCSSALKYVRPRPVSLVPTPQGMLFKYYNPNASTVTIAGDWNDWGGASSGRYDPHIDALTSPKNDGVWQIYVKLQPGKHIYKFVIDSNTWIADPGNVRYDSNGNSEVTVSEQEASQWAK